MSSKDDVFLEEARLDPRAQVLVDCEAVPNIPRLVRRFREYVLTDLAFQLPLPAMRGSLVSQSISLASQWVSRLIMPTLPAVRSAIGLAMA